MTAKLPSFDMNTFYDASCLFNEIAGNDLKVTLADFKDQQGYNLEECAEISSGISNNDAAEILDGVLDNFVTNFGHLQRLEKLGFNVGAAMAAIALNNLSKCLDNVEDLERTLTYYEKEKVPVYEKYNENYEGWVVKRTKDHKIMKPVGFSPVQLEAFIPADILKNGLKV